MRKIVDRLNEIIQPYGLPLAVIGVASMLIGAVLGGLAEGRLFSSAAASWAQAVATFGAVCVAIYVPVIDKRNRNNDAMIRAIGHMIVVAELLEAAANEAGQNQNQHTVWLSSTERMFETMRDDLRHASLAVDGTDLIVFVISSVNLIERARSVLQAVLRRIEASASDQGDWPLVADSLAAFGVTERHIIRQVEDAVS